MTNGTNPLTSGEDALRDLQLCEDLAKINNEDGGFKYECISQLFYTNEQNQASSNDLKTFIPVNLHIHLLMADFYGYFYFRDDVLNNANDENFHFYTCSPP